MPDPTFESAFADSTGWKKLAEVQAAEVPTIREFMEENDHERCVWTHPNGFRVVVVWHRGELFARAVHQPLDISKESDTGTAAERATLVAASGFGLPDLVFQGLRIAKGNATREIGDGWIVSGTRGLALQVKARTKTEDEPLDGDDTNWVIRQVKKAAKQASGSIRSLQHETVLTNYRNRKVVISELGPITWVRTVIVDHPNPPEIDLPTSEPDLVVLTRRDWEFLFRQLLSTSAVVDYVHRIAGEPSSLGGESNRYFELALADLDPEPGGIPDWVDKQFVRSRPRLPVEPATEGDLHGLSFYRRILEAVSEIPIEDDETSRVQLLSAVDQFGGPERSAMGRLLVERLEQMRHRSGSEPNWMVTRVVPNFGSSQLGFAVSAAEDADERLALAGNWTMLRHAEFARRIDGEVTTVLILLSPKSSPLEDEEDWDCTVCFEKGPSRIDDDDFRILQDAIGQGQL